MNTLPILPRGQQSPYGGAVRKRDDLTTARFGATAAPMSNAKKDSAIVSAIASLGTIGGMYVGWQKAHWLGLLVGGIVGGAVATPIALIVGGVIAAKQLSAGMKNLSTPTTSAGMPTGAVAGTYDDSTAIQVQSGTAAKVPLGAGVHVLGSMVTDPSNGTSGVLTKAPNAFDGQGWIATAKGSITLMSPYGMTPITVV